MKSVFHPKAFLSHKRNVQPGLVARTRILQVLDEQESNIKGIMSLSGLGYNVIVYHLRLLEAERVAVRKGDKRPFVWELTGVGQQRLVNLKPKGGRPANPSSKPQRHFEGVSKAPQKHTT